MATKTKLKPQLEAEVKGLGNVYSVEAHFDEALQALGKSKKIISLRDLAYGRIRTGSESHLSQHYSYVKEGAIYVPNHEPLFVANSPILRSASKATEAHRKGNEFYVNAKKVLEQAEADEKKDPENRKVLTLKQRKSYEIPTNRFGEDEVTRWAFKDQAEDYGEFLRENGVDEMPVWLVGDQDYTNNQSKPFARQLWLVGLAGGRSDLVGDGRGLDCDNGVRGVSKKTGEASSHATGDSYTLNDFKKVLKAEGISGDLEKRISERLSKK